MKKLDKNKVYAFIGKAVVWTSLWAIGVLSVVWAFSQNTVF